ncbi:MAG: molybdopterin-dependent oxidoreductase [Caulobacterales bacterium]|uniref:molybdopterin-dependent oxidoreductase n=1 Tax=Glycocaulis sp. TaxID=1969725 RepID=UPI003F9EFECC
MIGSIASPESRMLRIALAGLALLAAGFALNGCGRGGIDPEAISRTGPVVLVITGVDEDNRGTRTVTYEGLYAIYGIEVQTARGFTRPDLMSMSWRQMRADFPVGGEVRLFDGPRLSDVLRAAGLEGASVRLTAMDGYEAEVPAELIARYEPILALRADGEPLAIGGLGPVMLVWPRRNQDALSDMNDDLWPWGIFAITPYEPAPTP